MLHRSSYKGLEAKACTHRAAHTVGSLADTEQLRASREKSTPEPMS